MKSRTPDHVQRIDKHWSAIKKTLPARADHKAVRQGLEEIAARVDAEAPSAKALLEKFESRARLANQLIAALGEDNPALVETLTRQRNADRDKAGGYQREGDQRWRKRRYERRWDVLVLWDSNCGKVTAHTRGPHVDFFRVVSLAIWGKAPGTNQAKQIFREFRREWYFG